jgi:hypothetical protein
MSKIALRAYLGKISQWIDGGSNDDAIKHARYILKSFPKCVEAYRSLGKALLEKKEYAEAKDVFSRVLSVFPDDFVAHVGMSIIRENEGNLDAAIWHMELAYDIQPSNPILTEELRRLFGRRDGVQPPKIRMTRGALIRMYARGELYQQAIAECQSALHDDPGRIDLEVILAQMLYFSGALVDSADVCSKILAQLPYCYEANRLLTEILPNKSRAESAAINKARLSELDPYFSHVTSPDMQPSDIPENAILLDYLDEESQQNSLDESGWSKSKNLEWTSNQLSDTSIDEVRNTSPNLEGNSNFHPPKFMDTHPFQTPKEELEKSQDDFIQKEIEAHDRDTDAAYSPQQIPEWMRNAGWIPSTAASEEKLDNSSLSTENVNVTGLHAEPAEIPNWLEINQPLEDLPTGTEDANEYALSKEAQLTPELTSKNENSNLQSINDRSAPIHNDPEIQNTFPKKGETGGTMPSDSINKNEDEWLNQFRDDSSQGGGQNDLPDWLKDFETENEQPLEENMDIPEWLKSLEPAEAAEAAESVPSEEPIPPVEETTPVEKTESAVVSTSYVFTKMLSENETHPANLETTMLESEPEKNPPEETIPAAPLASEPEKPVAVAPSGLPAWVRNILKPQTPPSPPSEAPAEQPPSVEEILPQEEIASQVEPSQVPPEGASQEAAASEVLPAASLEATPEPAAGLSEEPIQDLPTPASSEGAISSDVSSELLDWLRGFSENEEKVEEATPAPVEGLAAAEEPAAEVEAEMTAESMGSLVEPLETNLPITQAEQVEAAEPVIAPMNEPLAEEPLIQGAEELSTEEETSWFEELPHEEEILQVESRLQEIAEPVSAEPAAETTEASETLLEEPRPVIEEAMPGEAEAVIETQLEPAVTPVAPEPLEVAMKALDEGNLDFAVDQFDLVLQDETKLPELIDSLKFATSKHGENSDLWQLMGDAFARTNQFDDAFAAYDKAEEMLLAQH